ncbi:TPA: DUF1934 domain-containing protein [Streptococcus suis]|nr:DUF1934 domain-containing protein [Streptococcus suis]
MNICLRNEIDLDGQLEVINQTFPVEVKKKDEKLYLIYQNEEEEKVVLKCDEQELVMTRFSNPKSIMRFVKNQEAIVTIPTPLGIQHFVTQTSQYELKAEQQELILHYVLKGLENQQILANYKMKISWK